MSRGAIVTDLVRAQCKQLKMIALGVEAVARQAEWRRCDPAGWGAAKKMPGGPAWRMAGRRGRGWISGGPPREMRNQSSRVTATTRATASRSTSLRLRRAASRRAAVARRSMSRSDPRAASWIMAAASEVKRPRS